jgi:hypothetical protein
LPSHSSLRLFPNVDGRRATFLSRTINDPSRSSIVHGGGKRRDVTATVWPGCSSPLHRAKVLKPIGRRNVLRAQATASKTI